MKKNAFILCSLFFIRAVLLGQTLIPLGKPGTPGELIFPRQVTEGPDGNIYAYDQADAFIKVYSPSGDFIRKIGGKGQGPGEIQRPDGVSFGFLADEAKLFFSEFFGGHPWITIVDLNGQLDRVVKPQLKEFFGISRAVSLRGGNFLVDLAFLGQPEREKDYFYHRSKRELVLMDTAGQILSSLKKTNHITRISFVHDGADSPIPFTPMFLWCPFDEKSVLFSDGVETRIQVVDFSGKVVREMATPLPPSEKVTKRDLEEWKKRRREMMASRDPDWWARFGKVIDKYKKSIYSHKPTIWEVMRTPEGRFLFASRVDADQPERGYWLMDDQGREIVKVKTQVWIMGISPAFIFVGEVDQDGVPSVKAIRRQGKEEEDLRRLCQ